MLSVCVRVCVCVFVYLHCVHFFHDGALLSCGLVSQILCSCGRLPPGSSLAPDEVDLILEE